MKRILISSLLGVSLLELIGCGTAKTAIASNDRSCIKFEESNDVLSGNKDSKITASDGIYKVGVDIDPGEYLFIANETIDGYYSVSNNGNDIIVNNFFAGNDYLTVKEGQYLQIQNVNIYKVEEAPSIIPSDGIYKDGTYLVGKDIPSGDYKLILQEERGYYSINTDSCGNSTISSDSSNNDNYVSVSNGQYLVLDGYCIEV